jgi:hypothetical protein
LANQAAMYIGSLLLLKSRICTRGLARVPASVRCSQIEFLRLLYTDWTFGVERGSCLGFRFQLPFDSSDSDQIEGLFRGESVSHRCQTTLRTSELDSISIATHGRRS